MSSMHTLDVGLANELKLACRRNNVWPEELKRLCEGTTLAEVRSVLLGLAKITYPEIDLDADTTVPQELTEGTSGWKVFEHRKGGKLAWDPSKLRLKRSKVNMRGDQKQVLDKLNKDRAYRSALNVNALEYLLKRQHLIPDEWREMSQPVKHGITYVQQIYFWGTMYAHPDGTLYVPGMRSRGFGWERVNFYFGTSYNSSNIDTEEAWVATKVD